MPQAPKTDQEKHPENYFISPAGHPRDRIMLHETVESPKGGRFISLNGFPFMAQCGVEIDLPRPVRLMLDTLIRTETVVREDQGRIIRESRNIQRFPYVLVKENVDAVPDAAVIDAAQKLTGDAKEVTFP